MSSMYCGASADTQRRGEPVAASSRGPSKSEKAARTLISLKTAGILPSIPTMLIGRVAVEHGLPELIERPKDPYADPFGELLYQQARIRAGTADFAAARALLTRISEIPHDTRYELTTWHYEFAISELACFAGDTDSAECSVVLGIEKLNEEWSERVTADQALFPQAISEISEALRFPMLSRFPDLRTDLEQSLCLSCLHYLSFREERLTLQEPPYNHEAFQGMFSLDETLAPVEHALKVYRRRSSQTAWSKALLSASDSLCKKLAGGDDDLRCVRHLTMARLNRVMGDTAEAKIRIEEARGAARRLFPALAGGDLARGYAQCELPEQASFLCREFWEGIGVVGGRALGAFQDPLRAALWCFRQRTQVALAWNDMASRGLTTQEPAEVMFERSDRIMRDIVSDAMGVQQALPRRVILLQIAEHCISGGQIVGTFLAIQALMNGMIHERRTDALYPVHQQMYLHLAELLGRVGNHSGLIKLARHVKRCAPFNKKLLGHLASAYLGGARHGSDIQMDGDGYSYTTVTPILLGLGNNPSSPRIRTDSRS